MEDAEAVPHTGGTTWALLMFLKMWEWGVAELQDLLPWA